MAVEPLGWCGSCLRCAAGQWNHCSGDFTAYGVFADGGMAVLTTHQEVSLTSGQAHTLDLGG